MQRVLITGAGGFIGRALAAYLVQQGFGVRATSRGLLSLAGVHTLQLQRYANDEILAAALHEVDVVVHLAARAHQTVRNDNVARYEENLLVTQSLLEASRQAGVSRFVHISSVGVHGNQTFGTPYRESDALAPAEPYAVSKRLAEEAVARIQPHGMQYVIIRPPLVYGPAAPGNFGRLLRAVASGFPLPLGGLHNRRSLVSLGNLLDFIRLCMAHPHAANQAFLVSDGDDLSTTDLLQHIRRGLLARGRAAAPLLPIPPGLLRWGGWVLRKEDMIDKLCASLQVDITKARTVLGWAPPHTVDAGIASALDAMQP